MDSQLRSARVRRKTLNYNTTANRHFFEQGSTGRQTRLHLRNMETPTKADLVIDARWVIPVVPANTTLPHHSIVVDRGQISDLLPTPEADVRYRPVERVSLTEHAVLPGLVNTHTHAAMSLMRGIADDLPLMRWLSDAIWPAERRHISHQFVYEGSLIAAAEMLRGGITCLNDMYFFPDAAAQAFSEAGIRAVVGTTVIDFPSNYATSADECLRKGLQARDHWDGHPLVSFALAPHAPYTVSNATFERIASLAEELDAIIHIHALETRQEVADSLRIYGLRPIARMDSLGLLSPNLLIAHAIHLTDDELDLLASRNAKISHNPTSNMKLGNGIAPISKMLARNMTISLGTDGAASNNRLDLLREMNTASLLAKAAAEDATILPAHRTIEMATLGGAEALGLQNRIGSIERGKDADLCAISLGSPTANPCFDPASHVVFVCGRESISDVWVRGSREIADGRLLRFSNRDLLRISRMWQNVLCR